MMKKPSVAMSDERRWQAEADMRTLRDAQMIKSDRARLQAATSMAKKELAALNSVAKTSPRNKTRPPTRKR